MQTIVIDAHGHMLGRLASIAAKQLLGGQQLVCPQPREHSLNASYEAKDIRPAEGGFGVCCVVKI